MSKSKQSKASEDQWTQKMLKSITKSIDYIPIVKSPNGDGPEVPITAAVYTFIWLYCRQDLTAQEEYEVARIFDAAAFSSSAQERMLKVMDRKIHSWTLSQEQNRQRFPRDGKR